MTPCIWLGTTHPCNPPHYHLWVNLHFFTMCICKHCFLPMLLAFAMKCCTKIPCPLPHTRYCFSLPSPVCLPHLLISSPIAFPSSSVLCWCQLCFLFFCFMLHFFVTSFWLVCVHIFSFVMIFLLWCNHPIMFPWPWKPNVLWFKTYLFAFYDFLRRG